MMDNVGVDVANQAADGDLLAFKCHVLSEPATGASSSSTALLVSI